ncbi:universal stress protein [Mycolicibacterium fluoranthenivorans]|jgi:nucleotide-binding universal stress UspA family protein|uniref:Universal stress protein n=1 Tax=Mycolicibacterium fluoranthenivorans TaxID=258505 RepID=A0A7G8P9C5_9MYCO|nr:universal stress protein [Mycolicibacterium fluoranthenivorans]QNJ90941.1 universal stress protein [Mycolicibacterium fluoranthenivorans]
MSTDAVSKGKPLGIVVAADGSPASRVAVDWAARDAELRGATLTVVHVVPTGTMVSWMDVPISEEYWAERDRLAEKVLTDALGVVADAISEHPSVVVQRRLLSAPVVPALVELSADADMVVVGCRGLGGVGRLLLGSVSSGLVHRAHCPVAVIRDEDPLMPDPAHAPVVVGIDGSPASELATEIAFEEATRRGVELVAVHVWSDRSDDLATPYWGDLQRSAEVMLAEHLKEWTKRHPEVTVRPVLECNHPARQLLSHADKAQLLVVGSHGRGGAGAMLLGSVSSAVVHAARMPVIVARAD